MRRHEFALFADYHQFYLQDEQADGDLSDHWTPGATDRLLAVAPGVVGVGTARDTTVPVTVAVLGGPPPGDEDLSGWDQVNECSLSVPSGRIVVAGCTDYFPEAARIDVAPGSYRARIYYGGLDTLSEDGLEGSDRYAVALWLAPEDGPNVVKPREPSR